jgi:NADH:ubiquinone oxidoreductase subunit E
MDIYICIGSACHLKGSYQVIKKFEKFIDKHPDKNIVLKSSFCLGKCSEGVSVKIGSTVYSVSIDSVEDFLKEKVLGVI